jgi:5'-deoxynucleotidase YfbR-like HD superfamily hydrolase
VVEKSREIYENLMDEEELAEAESTDDEDDKAEKAGEKVTKDIEYDDKKDRKERMDEEDDEEIDENLVPVPAGGMEEELMNDVEAEETGMDMAEGEGEEDLEDRVVDLEDKLDELMAEFEALMGDNGDSMDDKMGGDDLEMDDTETAEFSNGDEESEEEEVEMGMMEAVNLAKAPAAVTTEPAGTNTKSTVTANSGAKGAMAHPVKMTGDTAEGRPAPKAGELIGKVQNSVGGDKKLTPATKPHLAQATGVNTKTPFPKA